MSIKNFITGNGSIIYDDEFISIRLIKEALDKKYRIIVLEESAKHIKCKIIRYARLYGAPIIFPNPTINLFINKEADRSILQYSFKWPEYCLAALGAVLAGITSMDIAVFIFALLFFGTLIFLDTKWFSSRINKILSKIGV